MTKVSRVLENDWQHDIVGPDVANVGPLMLRV